MWHLAEVWTKQKLSFCIWRIRFADQDISAAPQCFIIMLFVTQCASQLLGFQYCQTTIRTWLWYVTNGCSSAWLEVQWKAKRQNLKTCSRGPALDFIFAGRRGNVPPSTVTQSRPQRSRGLSVQAMTQLVLDKESGAAVAKMKGAFRGQRWW